MNISLAAKEFETDRRCAGAPGCGDDAKCAVRHSLHLDMRHVTHYTHR